MVVTCDRILLSELHPFSLGLVPSSNREHSPPCLYFRPTSPYSVFRETSFSKAKLDKGSSLPPIVHAFHGSKVVSDKSSNSGKVKDCNHSPFRLTRHPPLWTHPTGCDFARGNKLVARPHVSDRAQPDQEAGVATESLDGSGSPQSQQQPHLAPDLPVLTCWVASHVTPRLCLRTSLGDRAVSRASPGPIGTHVVGTDGSHLTLCLG